MFNALPIPVKEQVLETLAAVCRINSVNVESNPFFIFKQQPRQAEKRHVEITMYLVLHSSSGACSSPQGHALGCRGFLLKHDQSFVDASEKNRPYGLGL